MKLYNITKSLILEMASIDSVIDAIKKKNRINPSGDKGMSRVIINAKFDTV